MKPPLQSSSVRHWAHSLFWQLEFPPKRSEFESLDSVLTVRILTAEVADEVAAADTLPGHGVGAAPGAPPGEGPALGVSAASGGLNSPSVVYQHASPSISTHRIRKMK